MKLKPSKLSALASGVALSVAAMAASAADQPSFSVIGPGAATASITGGATINGGASYLSEVPAAVAADLVATITPATADMGSTGGMVVVLEVPGLGFFNLLSGGIWVPVTDPAAIAPFVTGPLMTTEVSILDGLIAADAGLAGATLNAYVGYYTGEYSIAGLTLAADPISITLAEEYAAGCPTGTTVISGITQNGKPVCSIPAGSPITTDLHLTANNAYFFNGSVFIGENTQGTPDAEKTVLTIDAGTEIIAEGGTSALVINRGGKIEANGTADSPIIMTSAEDDGTLDVLNARGLWGGLVINGSAQLNSASGYEDGEGSTGQFGGGTTPINDDDSGTLTYLQIRYAGFPITQDDELNSLALQGTGSGTLIDYVHIHNGADDGVEFYGGRTSAKHLLLTGMDDDAVDWTLGYIGNVQHVIVKQTTSGDNCIEADNFSSNPTATPRSIPTVSNFTCIGSETMRNNGHALEIKEGTGGLMYNFVIGGVFPNDNVDPDDNEGCIRMNGEATFAQSGDSAATLNGTLIMENSVMTPECAADLQGSGTFTATEWWNAQANSTEIAVDLGGPNGWANGSLINAQTPNIPSDSFFDQVDYIGAVKDESSDWTEGWSFDYD